MDGFLSLGATLGAIFGLIHAVQVYRQRVADEGASPGRAAWFALWAVGLWILFGGYLLLFWIIGAIGMTIAWLRRSPGMGAGRQRPARRGQERRVRHRAQGRLAGHLRQRCATGRRHPGYRARDAR